MKMNLRNMCYTDAIFFADKLLHLQHSRTEQFVKAVYDLGKILKILNYLGYSSLLHDEQGVPEMRAID